LSALAAWPSIADACAAPLSLQGFGTNLGRSLPFGRMSAVLTGYFLFGVGYIGGRLTVPADLRAEMNDPSNTRG
jgi:hypothetical protein